MIVENGAPDPGGKHEALVIGGGPAGLMAADVLAEAGLTVTVADGMPSVGRKFLMAGKSGLNLTKAEPLSAFLDAYDDVPDAMIEALTAFGPDAVVRWAEALGAEVFTGTTGRVFPTVMKASPLLRAWLARLDARGVALRTRWRWIGWDGADCVFNGPDGEHRLVPAITVLALGGASWRRLGSDGHWADILSADGHDVVPFQPANMGFRVAWSEHMSDHFGAAVKATCLSAGALTSRGEWVISNRGIEGGGIYEVSRAVRDGAPLSLDLLPDLTLDEVTSRLTKRRGSASLSNHLRKTLRLGPTARALLMEWGRPLPAEASGLAQLVKALPVRTEGPLDMDGAISTAGGVAWSALNGLALRGRPATYVAGEMLDWEAPTGGYLITGCLATGRAAALQALAERP